MATFDWQMPSSTGRLRRLCRHYYAEAPIRDTPRFGQATKSYYFIRAMRRALMREI